MIKLILITARERIMFDLGTSKLKFSLTGKMLTTCLIYYYYLPSQPTGKHPN